MGKYVLLFVVSLVSSSFCFGVDIILPEDVDTGASSDTGNISVIIDSLSLLEGYFNEEGVGGDNESMVPDIGKSMVIEDTGSVVDLGGVAIPTDTGHSYTLGSYEEYLKQYDKKFISKTPKEIQDSLEKAKQKLGILKAIDNQLLNIDRWISEEIRSAKTLSPSTPVEAYFSVLVTNIDKQIKDMIDQRASLIKEILQEYDPNISQMVYEYQKRQNELLHKEYPHEKKFQTLKLQGSYTLSSLGVEQQYPLFYTERGTFKLVLRGGSVPGVYTQETLEGYQVGVYFIAAPVRGYQSILRTLGAEDDKLTIDDIIGKYEWPNNHRSLVIPIVHSSEYDPSFSDIAYRSTFSDTGSLNDFYQEVSFGRFPKFHGDITPVIQVDQSDIDDHQIYLGGYHDEENQYMPTLIETKLVDLGYTADQLTQYDHIIFYIRSEAGGGGSSTVGRNLFLYQAEQVYASLSWNNLYDELSSFYFDKHFVPLSGRISQLFRRNRVLLGSVAWVTLHELGHALGTMHENLLTCNANKNIFESHDYENEGDCSVIEYLNIFNVMGDGPGTQNGLYKDIMGILYTGERQIIHESGLYELGAVNDPQASRKYALIEVDDALRYFVEWKLATGYDAGLGYTGLTDNLSGLFVYKIENRGGYPTANLLDLQVNPLEGSSYSGASYWYENSGIAIYTGDWEYNPHEFVTLIPGASYQNKRYGFTISNQGIQDGKLQFNVDYDSIGGCGNGIIETPNHGLFNEWCDDGEMNGEYVGGCTFTCDGEVESICGDGLVSKEEICDDGLWSNGQDGHCWSNCQGTNSICGDGVLSSSEECDASAWGDDPYCTLDCTLLSGLYEPSISKNVYILSGSQREWPYSGGVILMGDDALFMNEILFGYISSDDYEMVIETSIPSGLCVLSGFQHYYTYEYTIDYASGVGGFGYMPTRTSILLTGHGEVFVDCNIRQMRLTIPTIYNHSRARWYQNFSFFTLSSGFDTAYICEQTQVDIDENVYIEGSLICYATPDVCGNRLVEGDELCDEAEGICWYGDENCMVCNNTCQLVAGAMSYCGDGSIEEDYELCDDGEQNGNLGYCNYFCSGPTNDNIASLLIANLTGKFINTTTVQIDATVSYSENHARHRIYQLGYEEFSPLTGSCFTDMTNMIDVQSSYGKYRSTSTGRISSCSQDGFERSLCELFSTLADSQNPRCDAKGYKYVLKDLGSEHDAHQLTQHIQFTPSKNVSQYCVDILLSADNAQYEETKLCIKNPYFSHGGGGLSSSISLVGGKTGISSSSSSSGEKKNTPISKESKKETTEVTKKPVSSAQKDKEVMLELEKVCVPRLYIIHKYLSLRIKSKKEIETISSSNKTLLGKKLLDVIDTILTGVKKRPQRFYEKKEEVLCRLRTIQEKYPPGSKYYYLGKYLEDNLIMMLK